MRISPLEHYVEVRGKPCLSAGLFIGQPSSRLIQHLANSSAFMTKRTSLHVERKTFDKIYLEWLSTMIDVIQIHLGVSQIWDAQSHWFRHRTNITLG